MILKVMYGQNSGQNWAFFDVDKFYSHQIDMCNAPLGSETILLPGTDVQKIEKIQSILYFKNNEQHEIITNRVVWILNNEGKTIDRIN
jgi:hypothetical protein